jgi:tRNA (guanine37-N1)-methyltransferase
MRFDIVTIFPEFFGGPLDYGIVRRAREARLIEIGIHDLRNFTHDRHRTVDDRPFGGGEGMVLKPEPIFKAVESVLGCGHDTLPGKTAIVLLSASGKIFRQETARRFSKLERIVLLCGRYEGVDERVAEHLATDDISIGDFVLSGGELPAGLIIDAVARLIPGALGNEDSAVNESFSESTRQEKAGSDASEFAANRAANRAANETASAENADSHEFESRAGERGILDYPHYTRPPSFRGWDVPEILLSGNHAEILRWRRRQAIEKTRRNRPDLLDAGNPKKSER